MSNPKPLPLDPKEVIALAGGVAIGVAIIAFFVLLAMGLDLPTLVKQSAIPHQ